MMLNRKLYYITIYISNLIYFAVVLCLSFGPWPFGITPIWLYLTRARSLDLLLIASNLHRIALDHHVQASLNMHNIIRYRDACIGLVLISNDWLPLHDSLENNNLILSSSGWCLCCTWRFSISWWCSGKQDFLFYQMWAMTPLILVPRKSFRCFRNHFWLF